MEKSEIKIYKSENGNTSIQVKLEKETVWLSQKQMAELFEKDSDTIGLHLKNIYKSEELNEISTTEKYSVVRQEGNRKVKRQIKYYNLDAIISVGYRVNSKRGIIFRKWATQLLKEYLIKGFAVNQEKLETQNKRLLELKKTVKILSNVVSNKELSSTESKGLLDIISDYSYALDILDKYDYQSLKIENVTTNEIYQLTYEEAIEQIQMTKKVYGNSDLFGREKDKSFRSSIATIYQTFGKVDLYPSIEEKAANFFNYYSQNIHSLYQLPVSLQYF